MTITIKKTKKNTKKNTKKPFKIPPYEVIDVVTTLSQSQDWGISQNNVPNTWSVSKGENTVIMVLDTGYTNHNDLQGAILVNESITTVGGDKVDRQYHSTHCCGIIGARNNGFGVVGVAPECKIITVKVLGDNGTGSVDSLVTGLKYAAKIKPDVVSMSLGASRGSSALHAAIKKLYDMNIPCVAAAGNEGPNSSVSFPARYPEVIAVGAYDKRGKSANFSSPGKEVFISCPGVEIYSTYRETSYAKLSGTSMATPFLAGVLSLLISKHKKQEADGHPNDCKTVEEIKNHLIKYAIDKGSLGKDNNFGWGILDVEKLITEREIIVPPTPDPTPETPVSEPPTPPTPPDLAPTPPTPSPPVKRPPTGLWERLLRWFRKVF